MKLKSKVHIQTENMSLVVVCCYALTTQNFVTTSKIS